MPVITIFWHTPLLQGFILMHTKTIPFKTPTINHLYGHWRGNVVMKQEAKLLRARIKELCDEDMSEFKDKQLAIEIEIHEDWHCKNGKVKQKDIANREKFLVDSIFNAYGLEDKFIFSHKMIKKQNKNKEFAIIRLQILPQQTTEPS